MSAKPKKPTTRPKKPRATTLAANNLPQPQLVPRDQVGQVVQDFIDFGGVRRVVSIEQPGGLWLVSP